MRPLVTLVIAALLAVVLPTAGEAQYRGGGFHGGGFGRFHPRPWPARERPPGPPASGRPELRPDEPAPEWDQQEAVRQGVREGRYVPLGPVIDGLQRRAPGRQLDTVFENEDGRMVYRVRWVTTQGRRIDYVVDAATGRFVGER